MERRDRFEEISLEILAIEEMRGRNRGGENPLCQGPVSEGECKPMFGGDLDITLGNKIDVLVPVKARSGASFQGYVSGPRGVCLLYKKAMFSTMYHDPVVGQETI